MLRFFALVSHNDDLHPHETLSVQSYKLCDRPSFTSHTLLVCRIIPILTIAVLAPIIDNNSERGYVEVSFGVALFVSYCFVCVHEKEFRTSGSSLLLQHYIRQ